MDTFAFFYVLSVRSCFTVAPDRARSQPQQYHVVAPMYINVALSSLNNKFLFPLEHLLQLSSYSLVCRNRRVANFVLRRRSSFSRRRVSVILTLVSSFCHSLRRRTSRRHCTLWCRVLRTLAPTVAVARAFLTHSHPHTVAHIRATSLLFVST